MKVLDVQLPDYTNYNVFLFKDEFYNYLLRGNKLCLCPLGHRKPKEYQLDESELAQLIDYYVLPLQKLRNEHLYVEGFINEALDVEDDMIAFIDMLIK